MIFVETPEEIPAPFEYISGIAESQNINQEELAGSEC
jgi:hypothetical protein